ncbi:helix-turn-helix domain-containing protein [Nocardia sp. NPDC051570]|uniref:helix-turn-helix domain-containing protein n=1 Tax=Nocardia sp. NPDC051570 TaxID=3364324 RepID=UPI0037AC5444
MSNADDDQPSTLAQRELGRFLRDKREGIGLTLQRAARLAELSKTALQRLETASLKKKYRTNDVRALCEIYEVDPEETARAIELAEQAKDDAWCTGFSGVQRHKFTIGLCIDLERIASRITDCNEIVPGLLQTADYARVLIGSYYYEETLEEIEQRVNVRMKRQAIVTRRAQPVELDVLLHESALHRIIGNRHIMRAQLHHLAEMGKRSNVTIRIVPFSAGCPRGLLIGPFVIFDFEANSRGRSVAPSVAYLEKGDARDLFLHRKGDIDRYRELVSVARAVALNEQQSRDLLRRAARSYER